VTRIRSRRWLLVRMAESGATWKGEPIIACDLLNPAMTQGKRM
jgi:hypothetical protein